MGPLRFTFLILCLLLVSCGQHQADSQYFEKSGQEVIVDEDQAPLEKMKRAIFDGDLTLAKNLIQSNQVRVTDQLSTGRNFLEESVYLIRFSMIRYFVNLGIDPKFSQVEGQSLIEWIETQPEKEILLRALLKTEIDDQLDLMSLIENGTYQSLQALLNQSIEVNFIDPHTSETPLTYAILNKKNNALRALFAQIRLDVNLKNKNSESPLMIAKRLNLKNIENELIRRNAQE